MIKIGTVFPQTEYNPDPTAVRDYAQTVEGLGFNHVLAYSHVLGANPDRPGGLQGPYTYESQFIEPLLMFSFMAAATETLKFVTGIIILPQRQTVLFAKQAATLDVLCGGRLRIGIGIGWNPVEYTSLGEDFHNRGKRVEEQVEVLRELWIKPLVSYNGRWHNIPDAGINPLPVQRPIPIWFGGHHDNVLQRIAKMGDGWMTNYRRPENARPSLERLKFYLEENGRTMDSIGLESRTSFGDGNIGRLHNEIQEWEAAGATHISINTMGLGFRSPGEHLEALERFASIFLQVNSSDKHNDG